MVEGLMVLLLTTPISPSVLPTGEATEEAAEMSAEESHFCFFLEVFSASGDIFLFVTSESSSSLLPLVEGLVDT